MTGPLLAGIAITSHNQGTASAVTLDTVSVERGRTAPARGLPERLDVHRHRHRGARARQPDACPAAPGA